MAPQSQLEFYFLLDSRFQKIIDTSNNTGEDMSDGLVKIKTDKYGTFHINETNMNLYWYYTWERMNVWHNRFILNLPKPWTKDSIIASYSFTNAYRELDKTTIWYHKHIGNLQSRKGIDVTFGTFIHRLFNRIETMEKILDLTYVDTFNEKKMYNVINGMRLRGERIWCTAHMTTGVRFKGSDDKLENIIYLIKLIHDDIKEIHRNIKNSASLEDLYNNVRNVNGFGPFLGYQCMLDIVNSGVKVFSLDDFVVAGPGCKRGIRHVFPNAAEITFDDAMRYMRENQEYYFDKYNYDFKYCEELGGKKVGIHLAGIENSFCEFSKYKRIWSGGRAPKNKYTEEYKGTRKLLKGILHDH
jgi:hypothetical protein